MIEPDKIYTGRSTIRMFNMDCMDYLEQCEENQYELAIVDPPYGIERFKSGGSHINKYGTENQNWNNIKPTQEYFNSIFKISDNQIIWGANNFSLPVSEYFIVWQKGVAVEFSFAMVEQAWTNIKKPAKIFKKLHAQTKDYRIHPTQKPIDLYRWLLQNYATEGDTILDTHGGSMSIAIACWEEGFDLDIIELDEDYFNEAVTRFENHIKQGVLF